VIPLAIDLSERMDIVRHRIGVGYPQRLADLNSQHARAKPAALLVNGDRRRGRLKILSFQAAFDIHEDIR
jgi:hypothetical protein